VVPVALLKSSLARFQGARLNFAHLNPDSAVQHKGELSELFKGVDVQLVASSICALKLLFSDTKFILTTDPVLWNTSEVYCEMKKKIDSLGVVNDVAERAIKLITDLSKDLFRCRRIFPN
jgi:hypothetical protein